MKWPELDVLIRHDESVFNASKSLKEQDPHYLEFKKAFNKNFQSDETRKLVLEIWEKYKFDYADFDTPLTSDTGRGAQVGRRLKELIPLPDVIFVSPYLRTKETLNRLTLGWPELKDVKTYEESRIREQDHGLSALYNDWRIFQALHPEQRLLYNQMGALARYWYTYPQGENADDVVQRNRSLMTTLTRDWSEKRVMEITHHLSILCRRAIQERWSPDRFVEADENEKPINLGVTIYKGYPDLGNDGHLKLESYNLKLYD